MPPAFSVPSREKWRKYEQGSMAKQQEFMERYREDFKKVLVENSDGIQAGDHLVLERKYYVHHMLCTFSGDNHVIVIHYSGPAWGISRASRCTSFKDVGVKGEIEEKMFSFEKLVEQQVKKIIWPAQLKRFSAKEVIKRAFTRLGENWYDILKNNCEHFVTWSMCGLKVSLQIEQWYLTAREVAYSAFTGLYDFGRNITKEKVLPLLIKLQANVSDELAAFINENALYVGYGLAILMEAGLAGHEIYKAYTYCKTIEEFKVKFVDIVAKAACRLGFGIVGSCIGTAVCPAAAPIASLVGGAIGAGLGHLFGALIGWWYENSPYMDG
ncbi:unnamed protein product [Porites evermanni]|uniref:LRAT domain-containing protein n=1 Tax=Porites evermanni TaxID=104178 RepID=A0ABN8M3V4_9CNID|nr:unnamed protein product [Porites evermanni]